MFLFCGPAQDRRAFTSSFRCGHPPRLDLALGASALSFSLARAALLGTSASLGQLGSGAHELRVCLLRSQLVLLPSTPALARFACPAGPQLRPSAQALHSLALPSFPLPLWLLCLAQLHPSAPALRFSLLLPCPLPSLVSDPTLQRAPAIYSSSLQPSAALVLLRPSTPAILSFASLSGAEPPR